MFLNKFFGRDGETPSPSQEIESFSGEKTETQVEQKEEKSDLAPLELPANDIVKESRLELLRRKQAGYEARIKKYRDKDPDGYKKSPEYIATQAQNMFAMDLVDTGQADPQKIRQTLERYYGDDLVDDKFFKKVYGAIEDYVQTGGENVLVVKRISGQGDKDVEEINEALQEKLKNEIAKAEAEREEKMKKLQGLLAFRAGFDGRHHDDQKIIEELESDVKSLDQRLGDMKNYL